MQKNFDMDKINEFLNHKLPENFLYDDDQVIDKLEICIERLLRQKFEQGSIIEPIPIGELPKIPFGDFKKIEARPKATDSEPPTNKNRDAFVEKMAKDRLASEKKKRDDLRQKKREEKRVQAIANRNGDIETFLDDGGKPIRNISDEEDDDDDGDDDEDSESDEDDLNPSKISEYDDDKADKESMISNMTRQSSSQFSLGNSSSLEKKSSKTNGSSLNQMLSKKLIENKLNSNGSEASDYENLNSAESSNNRKDNEKVFCFLKITLLFTHFIGLTLLVYCDEKFTIL